MNIEFNIAVLLIGALIGCLATLAYQKRSASRSDVKAAAPNSSSALSMKALQQQLNSKQVMIDNFFTESNEELEELENHLSNIRKILALNAKQISNLDIKDSTKSDNQSEELGTKNLYTPPKDYAPKDDEEPGTLSEGFGLEEKKTEPVRTI